MPISHKKTSALLFVLFSCSFLFFPNLPVFGAETIKCCCTIETVYSAQDCKEKIECDEEDNSADCAENSVNWGVPTTYIETQAASCDKLKESICATEHSGVLAETSPGCAAYGNCNLCDGIKVFINIAQMIFGFSGAIALLFFIIGGFLMILSQGKQEMVERGKKMLIGTLVGLVIILGAWQMTRIAIFILVMPNKNNAAQSTQVEYILKVFTSPTENPCEYMKAQK